MNAAARNGAAEPRWRWPRAAYVHVPFCAHKCGYCDFASLAGVDHLADRYLLALEREIETSLAEPQEVDTIFVGGGTPTRLDAAQLSSALHDHQQVVDLSRRAASGPSRPTPARSTPRRPTSWPRRASIGSAWARSRSSRDCCAVLEREHGRAEVETALEVVRPRFPRWSLDLIFGVPGSTHEHWRDDLEIALSLGPSHLSCYGLVFEKGTALWNQQQSGLVQPVDEEVERLMYETTIDRLAAGRPGDVRDLELRPARPRVAAQPGLLGQRRLFRLRSRRGAVSPRRSLDQHPRPGRLSAADRGGRERDRPARRAHAGRAARETAMLMLRRTQAGIDRDDFQLRTGFDLDILVGQRDRAIHGAGLPGGRWAAGPAEPARRLPRRPRLL